MQNKRVSSRAGTKAGKTLYLLLPDERNMAASSSIQTVQTRRNIDMRCVTCWCPCITFGRIAEIVDEGTTSCAVSGTIYALIMHFTGCGCCCYSSLYRSKMRRGYALLEEPCADCLVHCCCHKCALRQEYLELQHQGFDMSLGWQGNMAMQNRGAAMAPVRLGTGGERNGEEKPSVYEH
ncbi:hypothetical protein RJ640_015633 [Escallonia rubra]|uniref:Uncharacterized protein n=1 Tax=Escallonia rubra TaxID=112253 RepID=A0AA88SLS2_9ASTE|nr:hypothetical protein RJ640_015633 [Escallonia rubra]